MTSRARLPFAAPRTSTRVAPETGSVSCTYKEIHQVSVLLLSLGLFCQKTKPGLSSLAHGDKGILDQFVLLAYRDDDRAAVAGDVLLRHVRPDPIIASRPAVRRERGRKTSARRPAAHVARSSSAIILAVATDDDTCEHILPESWRGEVTMTKHNMVNRCKTRAALVVGNATMIQAGRRRCPGGAHL